MCPLRKMKSACYIGTVVLIAIGAVIGSYIH